MQWTDIHEIAQALADKHEDVDPAAPLRFTDLHRWVMELDDFAGDPNRSNEKIFEAIQQAWIDEAS